MEIDLDHLRGWIGRETVTEEPVTPALVQRFNATFDRDGDVSPGAPAPPMIHLCLAPAAVPTATLGRDGHTVRAGFLPPVPLPRRMWAGGALEFTGAFRIGETAVRRSVLRNVELKRGRSGPLCFVTVGHVIHSGARPVLTERQDLVFLGLPSPGAPGATAVPAPQGVHRRVVTPSAPLLFRYSALTFNGHRIHYDAPYARGIEGYPGLVVHGPLQATLLVHLAESLRGRPPARLDYRSRAALCDDADFTLNARDDGDAMALWTCREGGPAAMEARAAW